MDLAVDLVVQLVVKRTARDPGATERTTALVRGDECNAPWPLRDTNRVGIRTDFRLRRLSVAAGKWGGHMEIKKYFVEQLKSVYQERISGAARAESTAAEEADHIRSESSRREDAKAAAMEGRMASGHRRRRRWIHAGIGQAWLRRYRG